MNIRTRSGVSVAIVFCVGLVGCASPYYLVKDPSNSAEYYTTAVKKSGSAVEFKDSKTLASMTLQNSQVTEITEDQYRAATGQH